MPQSNQPQELIDGYFLDNLTEEQSAELEALLLADKSLRDDFRMAAAIDAGPKQTAEDVSAVWEVDEVALQQSQLQRNAQKSSRSWSMVTLSLMVLVAIGGTFYWQNQQQHPQQAQTQTETESPTEAIAKLETISGRVTLLHNSTFFEATQGAEIYDGTTVTCPSGISSATIRTNDGSTISITPGTRLLFTQVEGQYRLSLEGGNFEADVQKQPEGRPMLVATPTANVVVLGTKLKLDLAADSTRLTVKHGQVEMKENQSNEKVLVATGETAVAQKGRPLNVKKVDDLFADDIEIISATYGAENSWVDVTQHVQKRTKKSRKINIRDYNRLAGDPIYLVVKTMIIKYKIDGVADEAEFLEDTEIVLPWPRK